MDSPELAYEPAQPLVGFTGGGFAEIDKTASPLVTTISVPEDGTYAVSVRYANGNGPVNTENKAAIRTLSVDRDRAGVLVMPTRGVANWNDWGESNYVEVPLRAGEHTLTIDFRPENNNMNIDTNHALIDCIVVEKIR